MTIKPNAKTIPILEQIIEDLPSGLVIQISAYDDSNAGFKLTLHGDILPFGNRDIIFDKDGAKCGGGTATVNFCRPSWLKEVQK